MTDTETAFKLNFKSDLNYYKNAFQLFRNN